MTPERIAELREWNRGGADEMTEALDEIDRLRSALDGVSVRLLETRWHPSGSVLDWSATADGLNHGHVMGAIEIARAALEGK